jgi:hypothetical protein
MPATSVAADGDEDMKRAADGIVAGFVVPKACSRALDQFVGELREHGVRLVIVSREQVAEIQGWR